MKERKANSEDKNLPYRKIKIPRWKFKEKMN